MRSGDESLEQKNSERSEGCEYRRETGPTGSGAGKELRSELVNLTATGMALKDRNEERKVGKMSRGLWFGGQE